MFIPLPVRFRDGRTFDGFPIANSLLIALNVIVFCLGWTPYVGPGTGLVSVLTYAFGHAGLWHLAGNMLALLVFGMPVNRRLGNGWFLVGYLGSALCLGLFARIFATGSLIGASGAIFAVIAMSLLLLPSAMVEIFYFALFPATLPLGLIWRPKEWVFWFIRWDSFEIRAWWGIIVVPLLELGGFYWHGWNWTNLGHLFGLVSGVAFVLLLPQRISMSHRSRPVYSSVL